MTGDKPAHICNLISGFCIYIIISSVAIKDKNKPTPKTWAVTIIERFTLCENDTPQIERYPSVRTICPRAGCREHPKKQICRCGRCSVAALAFHIYLKNVLKQPDYCCFRTFSGKRKRQVILSKLPTFYGGDEGIRTLDLSDANRTLSQLSYRPICAPTPRRFVIIAWISVL